MKNEKKDAELKFTEFYLALSKKWEEKKYFVSEQMFFLTLLHISAENELFLKSIDDSSDFIIIIAKKEEENDRQIRQNLF